MSQGIQPRLDTEAIVSVLEKATSADRNRVEEILAKARLMKGLDAEDVAVLCGISDPELLGELFHAARDVKEEIYGRRLVLFTPLYVSNLCGNDYRRTLPHLLYLCAGMPGQSHSYCRRPGPDSSRTLHRLWKLCAGLQPGRQGCDRFD